MANRDAQAPHKTLDQYFADWESHVFGFGYGTGEPYTIAALRRFLELCPNAAGYDYQELERELTPTVAWLLIDALCQFRGCDEPLEYGSSPRYAWLTPVGLRLKIYMMGHTTDELVEVLFDRMRSGQSGAYTCYPNACNCGPNGYETDRVCQNPFWLESAPWP